MAHNIFTLVGPTGVGKTDIAIKLAQEYNVDIISADSRQIYKYMDIGTAKPRVAVSGQRIADSGVRFHLVDIITPDILYSAADFAQDCKKVINELIQQKKSFILVGGSGLYLKALFKPFFSAPPRDLTLRKRLEKDDLDKLYARLQLIDLNSAQRIKPQDRQRIIRALEIYEQTCKPMSEKIKEQSDSSEFIPFYIGLTLPRKILNEKINQRFDKMIEDGLVNEVKYLMKLGYTKEHNALNGIGYAEIIRYLDGELSLMQAIDSAKTRSRQYAKRQMTWFKKLENVNWVDASVIDKVKEKVSCYYQQFLKLD